MPFKPVSLTEQESVLFGSIVFNDYDHNAYIANGNAAEHLMGLFNERKAIPEHRLRCFYDADYRRGRRKGSWKELIEKNGQRGECVFHNHAFWPFLQYFVEGPNLPDSLIKEYADEITRRSPVSPGDVMELTNIARKTLKEYGFIPSKKSDEIFRLCLDCEMYLGHAGTIRDYL